MRINISDINDIKRYKTVSEASRDNNVHEKAIYNAANGITISSAGYYWCFEKNYTKSWKPRSDLNKRKIICVENNKAYESIANASVATGINEANIARACKDSGLTAGGYHWAYAEDYGSTYKIRERKSTSIKVVCVELDRIFDSASHAASLLGLDNSQISKCCKDYSKTSGGYHWAFYDDYSNNRFKAIPKKIGKHGMRAVCCIELNKTFDSINDASRETDVDAASIGRACLGKQKVAGGFHWKYVGK